jgi:hypothetical protein
MLGLIVPAGTVHEWRVARDKSEAEGRLAERFAGIVAAALLAASTL